jgi:hypothetical protein
MKRPVGSDKPFSEHADLPTAASLDAHLRGNEAARKQARAPKARKKDEKAERRAAVAFENEERKREKQRDKEAAAAAKGCRPAECCDEKSRKSAGRRTPPTRCEGRPDRKRSGIERRSDAKEQRWQKLKSRLETAFRKASR